MKKYLLVSLILINIISCNSKKSASIERHVLLEGKVATDILGEYLRKINLHDLEKNKVEYEVRKWYPFYYTDSFPLALQRVYVENGELKGESYFFSDSRGGLILSKNEIANLRFEKYSIPHIWDVYRDSLKGYYNIGGIDTFDINILKNKNASYPSTSTPRKYLFEQADSVSYYITFITEPDKYPGLHKSIDKYAALSKFIFELFNKSDTAYYRWFLEKGQKIANYE